MVRPLLAAAIAGALVLGALPALAFATARPIAGGRYVGQTSLRAPLASGGSGKVAIAFTVADDRRSLVPVGRLAIEDSIIEEPIYGGGLPCGAEDWRIGQAQIDSHGRVRLRTRVPAQGLDLVLNGHFRQRGRVASGALRITGPKGCTRRITFTARFTGQRHVVRGSCTPPGTRTVRDDRRIRIFEERYVALLRGATRVTYACDRATRRRYVVDWDDHDFDRPHYTDKTAIAGRFVAYSTFECPSDFGCVATVGAFDAGSGRDVFITDALGPDAPQQIPGFVTDNYSVDRLVLKPDGAAAWTTCVGDKKQCVVLKDEGDGPKLLDSSGHVDRGSLRLEGSALHWTRAGAAQESTLN